MDDTHFEELLASPNATRLSIVTYDALKWMFILAILRFGRGLVFFLDNVLNQ